MILSVARNPHKPSLERHTFVGIVGFVFGVFRGEMGYSPISLSNECVCTGGAKSQTIS
jgi:hypothetical protein